ncbi:keratin-associated protein 19-2 [Galendromus occidentalis]|uniref:Keratin-associated protein 19-2 n=1 Tax=Galendromus occidentalis TaxID=34638 RepID=A0AAJ7L5K9_9ACAR|nr:keratin-associated protein 19-2 [Galendromus occidentalis]
MQFVPLLFVVVAAGVCCVSAGYLGHGYSSGISYSFDNQKAPLYYGKIGYGGYGKLGYGGLGYAGLGYGGYGKLGYGGYGGVGYGGYYGGLY